MTILKILKIVIIQVTKNNRHNNLKTLKTNLIRHDKKVNKIIMFSNFKMSIDVHHEIDLVLFLNIDAE